MKYQNDNEGEGNGEERLKLKAQHIGEELKVAISFT